MATPLCVLVLQLKELHAEKKAAADTFNADIKGLENKIFSLALQERNGQSDLFFGDKETLIKPDAPART